MARLVHGDDRPILHLQPGFLHLRRQFVHVLEEQRECPDLFVLEGVPERRHPGQANAVFDLPERFTLRVVFDTVGGQLGRPRIFAFRYR